MRVDELLRFMIKRHDIWRARQAGLPAPWTKDGILQSYRFCNVYRELDRETAWIRENWRLPLADHGFLFFPMLVARIINWHETLEEMVIPMPWNRNKFVDVLHKRKALGQKVWTGAYMVTTHRQAVSKERYYADQVLTPVWEDRKALAPKMGDTLATFHARLADVHGVGDFLAAQVVADTKHHGHLLNASDWWTWAAPGYGSVRGLNRLFDRPYTARIPQEQFKRELDQLHSVVTRFIQHERGHNLLPIDAQDLQNCLCEFDKYERARLQQGRPRSRYNGRGDV